MSAKGEADKARKDYPWTARQRRQKKHRRPERKKQRKMLRWLSG